MEHGDLTEKIIGCSFRVYGEMGFGFLESVYEKCMMIKFRRLDLVVETQKPVTVKYHDVIVGEFVIDLLVESAVLVELKSVHAIAQAHQVQLVNYLATTRLNVGLLINFGNDRVEVKKKVRDISSPKI